MRKDMSVSPVIGVILMVTITIILAAVIAALVLGMVDGVERPLTTIKIEDKIIQGDSFYFTDGKIAYKTDWISYRQIEVNHTYNFTCYANNFCIWDTEVYNG